ncbi:hypothetical protein MNBD_ALPHA01-1622 [hydrothermal vent metagenome]|uniref:FecR protein domain-containing protein n=1 Tax=hydrothermal vent metagenome TaxID=652676 RepID=A0A3B0SZ84_9ZZZZ
MSKIFDIPQGDDPMDIARKWYLKLEEDAGDDRLREQFEQWIGQDPTHREAFNAVVDFWSHIEGLPEIQEMRATGTDIFNEDSGPEQSGPQEKATIVDLKQKKPVKESLKIRRSWQRWAVAAMVLIVFSVGFNFYGSYLPEGTYQTATGEMQTIQLADGSTVYLNTDSRLRTDFTDRVRKIELLRGEAKFDVAHDENRPFIVETSRGDIRAVGTSFNIYDREEAVEIIVFEGTVAVEQKKYRLDGIDTPPKLSETAVLVTDGERIVVFDNKVSIIRAANALELSQKNAWRNGKLIFRGQKLSDVIKEMSRYTNRKIIITDDALSEMKMGGAFDIKDFEALLHAIEDTFPVRIIRFTPYITVIVEA